MRAATYFVSTTLVAVTVGKTEKLSIRQLLTLRGVINAVLHPERVLRLLPTFSLGLCVSGMILVFLIKPGVPYAVTSEDDDAEESFTRHTLMDFVR